MSASPASDGLAAPGRYWAVATLWIVMAMSVLDGTMVSIALPAIAADMGARPAETIWAVNAYQVAIIMALLPAGALGAAIGFRRLYLIGLALFTGASLACALAGDLPTLIAARFAQGIGAAAMMALNGALMRAVYPKALFARGIGWNGLVIAASAAAGPSIAALLLSLHSWRALFLVNLPLGLASLALGAALLPKGGVTGRRFDAMGALLTAALLGLVFAFLGGSGQAMPGWTALTALPGMILIALLLARHLRGREDPLLPLDLMRMPALRTAYLASITAFAAQMGMLVSLPFLLHLHFGLDVATTGLVLTPLPVGVGLASLCASYLAERMPAGRQAMTGLLLGGLGLLLLLVLADRLPILIAGPAALFGFGIGFGLFQTANNRVMLTTASAARAGAASAMLSLVRLLGQAAGALGCGIALERWGTASFAPVLGAAMLMGAAALLYRRSVRHDLSY